ncbi:hypothetical protein FIBSPDRAFT_896965 [Athelia psychrophila]|uniref:Nephrocystin 3-like N-terminal domain-containing protein n=1 Tax=Athelia psychrophila TaxID=1759441 RepID=A0A166CUM0_9AGAM|nr:hypothetical protein FIBSPDRAFT_896965 [Fibularhizoctonia sp. CBS 109695]
MQMLFPAQFRAKSSPGKSSTCELGYPGQQLVKTIEFYTSGAFGAVNNVAGEYITQIANKGPVAKVSRLLSYAEGGNASQDPKLACFRTPAITTLSLRDFWMEGFAGSGKSAIAHTISQKFKQKGRLASSFFFSRGTTGADMLWPSQGVSKSPCQGIQ